jgi:peroxiredoxin
MRKIILLVFILAATTVMGCKRPDNEGPSRPKIEVGSPAPDFTLRDLQEKNVSLSDYRGKVVLLTFWKVKCDECAKTLPSIEALKDRFKDRDLAVLAVNVDNLEYVRPEKIHGYIRDNKYSFRVLVDEIFSASEAYKIIALPMTYLIDKNGVISYMKFGEEDWTSPEDIERIQGLLKGESLKRQLATNGHE